MLWSRLSILIVVELHVLPVAHWRIAPLGYKLTPDGRTVQEKLVVDDWHVSWDPVKTLTWSVWTQGQMSLIFSIWTLQWLGWSVFVAGFNYMNYLVPRCAKCNIYNVRLVHCSKEFFSFFHRYVTLPKKTHFGPRNVHYCQLSYLSLVNTDLQVNQKLFTPVARDEVATDACGFCTLMTAHESLTTFHWHWVWEVSWITHTHT